MQNSNNKIYLNRNESQFGLSPRCKTVINNIKDELLTNYAKQSQISPNLLIKNLSNFLNLPTHQLVLGNGSEMILKICIHEYLKRNEYLLAPECSWWYYDELVSEIKGKVCHFKTIENDHSFSFDFNIFKKAYSDYQPTVVLLTSPNNPTGHSIDMDILEQVFCLCKNSIVIIDEAYWGFNGLNNDRYKYFIEKFPNIIFIRSFSKFFGLAGLRIGYAICGDYFYELRKYMDLYLGHSPLAVSLCIAAIEDIEYYINISNFYNKSKLDFYKNFNNSSIKVFHSDANFLLFKHEESLYDKIKTTFETAGYIISYLQTDILKNHIRISLGNSEQNQRVIELLKYCLDN